MHIKCIYPQLTDQLLNNVPDSVNIISSTLDYENATAFDDDSRHQDQKKISKNVS
jgi:hypothetical protein